MAVQIKSSLFAPSPLTAPEGQIHFVASKDFENVDFFQHITRSFPVYDFSNLEVYINGELTNQVANSISAKADDDIIIKATHGVYPWFGYYYILGSVTYSIDYIKSIEEPFPLMYQYNGKEIPNFDSCFADCSSLTSIPQGLFDNNPQVTDFSSCFSNCSSLTSIPSGLFNNCPNVTKFSSCFYNCVNLNSIPQGLFDNNTQATDFGGCFRDCSSLTSIPEGLFDNNPQVTRFGTCFYECSSLISIPLSLFSKHTKVTSFYSCFESCTNLTVNVQIGSTATSVDVTRFARYTKEKGTVYCKAGSAAYTAFSESTNANVDVLTY